MRKRYLLPCDCGRKLVIDAAQAGEQVRCECGVTQVAPTLRGLAALEPASEPTAAERAAARRGADRALKTDLAFAVCLFLLIGSVVALVPLVVIWLQLDTSFNIDSDVEYGNQQIDQLTIDRTWEVWTELQEAGLQPREVPFYTRILRYANVFSRVIAAVSVVAVLSLVGLVVSGLQSARSRAAPKRSAGP
jgi:hypothetical protein